MTIRTQLTVDCADPERLARFWAAALHYDFAPPPAGFADWTAFWRSIGVPEDELGDGGPDRIVDPAGAAPPIWFQQVPEPKATKNRLHLDLLVGGGREVPLPVRRERVDAEVTRLLALGASRLYALDSGPVEHYAVVLADPEGNEFCVV